VYQKRIPSWDKSLEAKRSGLTPASLRRAPYRVRLSERGARNSPTADVADQYAPPLAGPAGGAGSGTSRCFIPQAESTSSPPGEPPCFEEFR
jgi:hypothetical protein